MEQIKINRYGILLSRQNMSRSFEARIPDSLVRVWPSIMYSIIDTKASCSGCEHSSQGQKVCWDF